MAQRGAGPVGQTGPGGSAGGPPPARVDADAVEVLGEIDLPDAPEPPFTMGPPPTHRWIQPDRDDERWATTRFAAGLINSINPLPILRELFKPEGPGRVGQAIMDAHKEQFYKAKELYDLSLLPDQSWANRRLLQLQSFGHIASALTPLVGPGLANAGEKIGTGDVGTAAEGVGEAVGILAPIKAGLAARKPPKPAAPAPPPVNPMAAAAEGARLAHDRGIRISPGEARRSNVRRSLEGLAEETSFTGESVGRRRRAEKAQDMERVGRELAAETGAPVSTKETAGAAATQAAAQANRSVSDAYARTAQGIQQRVAPGSGQSPVSAGETLVGAVEGRVDALKGQARQHYEQFDEIVNDPANARDVVVRYEELPISDAARQAGVNPVRIPVTEKVQSPIDLEATNMMDTFRKVNEEWTTQWPEIRQQQSAAFRLLSSIVNSRKTVVPLADAEKLLGYAKTLAREEGGTAKLLVGKLQQAVDRAVADLGPDAQIALTKGRAASRAQWAANEVLASLKGVSNDYLTRGATYEPTRSLGKVTAADDKAIALLRRTAEEVPEAIPVVARTVLDEIFDTGLREGTFDFSKARQMRTAWDRLGDETKRILVKDPQTLRQIDDLFRMATRRQEQPMLRNLPAEAVPAFKSLVRDGDQSIGGLEALDRLTRDPQTGTSPITQQLARAWLDDQLDLATNVPGTLSHVDRLAANWRNLGPRTKRLLFGDNVHNLNAFFQLAKDMNFNANPSRTAFARIIDGKLSVVLTAPAALMTGNPLMTGAALFEGVRAIGHEAFAALLLRPATSKALVRAMRTPTSNPRASAQALAALVNTAKRHGIDITKRGLAATTTADEPYRSETRDEPAEAVGEIDLPDAAQVQ